MFRIRSKSMDFDRNLQPRERTAGFPKLALRRRSADHPMMMFGALAMTAIVSMIIIPTAGPAFASFGPFGATVERQEGAAGKTSRLPMTDTDIACRGQSWGAEDAQCLAMIAKESGRTDVRKVRMIGAFDSASL